MLKIIVLKHFILKVIVSAAATHGTPPASISTDVWVRTPVPTYVSPSGHWHKETKKGAKFSR